MRILVSNDDGVFAPGLKVLAEALRELGEVTVVAPDRNKSGASNSLTLDNPVRIARAENGYYAVTGTPTDCVHMAIHEILEAKPDLVVSGINSGPNLGDDVLYSGTVAAAMEGLLHGIPALALSLNGHDHAHYDSAARVAVALAKELRAASLPRRLLNINVPNLPWERILGVEVTRQGFRHRAEDVVRATDPKGLPVYWIGRPGGSADAGPGTDFHAIDHDRVSVTPLQIDLTDYQAFAPVDAWLSGLRP
ncbi:MAG: 5'/3'-nucleotidase SurE [Gammaproteobacteria bacterium]|nr:5'/3'-nucleotidase SurE [Gammaproteobacteria bacterium]